MSENPRKYLEDQMIEVYWSCLGCPGMLLPEYVMVEPAKNRRKRRADALILPDVDPPHGMNRPDGGKHGRKGRSLQKVAPQSIAGPA